MSNQHVDLLEPSLTTKRSQVAFWLPSTWCPWVQKQVRAKLNLLFKIVFFRAFFRMYFQFRILLWFSLCHKCQAQSQGSIRVLKSCVWTFDSDSEILMCMKITQELIKMQIPKLYPKSIIQQTWNDAQESLDLVMSQVTLTQMPRGTTL